MARTPEQIQAIEAALDKNADYWRERYARLEHATHLSAEGYIEELDKQYKLANKSIKDKLAYFYAQFADSENINLTEAKRILDADALDEFHMSVEEYIKLGEGPTAMDPDIQKKLIRASTKYRVTRLEAIELELAAELEQLRLKNQDIAYSAIGNAYRDRYYRSIYEVQKGIGIGSTFSKVDEDRLKTILDQSWVADGLNFSDRIWKNKSTLQSELTNALSQALILGQGYSETSEKFQNRMGVSFSNAARVIVTESAYYASTAQNDSFDELGVDEYEIVATLDKVTCDVCQHMDGKVFKMKDFKAGITAPPFHPNCRTTTCPHYDDSDLEGYTVGSRAARDDPDEPTYYVPADLNYDEWYDQYVLGNNATSQSNPVTVKMGQLDQQLPKVDYDSIKGIVEVAPYEMQVLWNQFADGIKFKDLSSKKDFYRPGEGMVHINMAKARKPRISPDTFEEVENPYAVAFHEMGHNIDHLIAKSKGVGRDSYFTAAHNGKADKLIEEDVKDSLADYLVDHFTEFFPKPLTTTQITSIDKQDPKLQELAEKYKKGEITIDDLLANEKIRLGLVEANGIQRKLKKDFMDYINNNFNWKERFAFSDIYEKPMKRKYPFGGGHGLSYWKNHQPALEAFAEILSSVMTNNTDAINAYKKFTPKLYNYFWEIIKEINGTN